MRPTRLLSLVLVIAMAASVAACSADDVTVTPTSDTWTCVYTRLKEGQHLFRQLPPGSGSINVNKHYSWTQIPTSNRFYMASTDSNRDPGAPKFYTGFAQNSTEVMVQGQIRFKFNQGRICDWYAKHGRRNLGDFDTLGFNARGNPEKVAQYGWFKFLAENFGFTMGQTVKNVMQAYDWVKATFDYPANADQNGLVPKDQKPSALHTDEQLAKELGHQFTLAINTHLGGQYFCGIDSTPTHCTDITFEVSSVQPVDHDLLAERAKFERTRQELANAQAEGALQEQQRQQISDSEDARQAILRKQLETAKLQARVDFAPCAPYAAAGLDCSREHQPLPVQGGSITINKGK
jgi:hypothetical protein